MVLEFPVETKISVKPHFENYQFLLDFQLILPFLQIISYFFLFKLCILEKWPPSGAFPSPFGGGRYKKPMANSMAKPMDRRTNGQTESHYCNIDAVSMYVPLTLSCTKLSTPSLFLQP